MNQATVLVVEDNIEVLSLLRLILQREGYAVIAVDSCAAACRYLIETRPDIMITDLMLPKTSGIECVRWVRQQPHLDGLPVVVLSAYERTYHGVALVAGANVVLRKPEDLEQLIPTLNEILTAKAAERLVV
jgi:two-component system, sensor histidine kinase and response regulator